MVLLIPIFLSCTGIQHKSQFKQLDSGWQYRIGDSPTDKNGRLVWLSDSLNAPGWVTAADYKDLFQTGVKSLWLRVKLPKWDEKNPGIIVLGISLECQVYIDQELVYQYGNFISLNDNHFHGWRQHPIQLPNDISGRMLTFRIWSNGPDTGISPPVMLGPSLEITKKLFVTNIDELLLSVLFIIMGITVLIMFIMYQKHRLYLGVSIFLVSMGFFTGSNSLFLQYIFNAPGVFLTFDIFSLFATPIGFYMIIEHIVLSRYSKIIKRFWQLALLYWSIVLIASNALNTVYLDLIYKLFFILFSSSFPITIYLIAKSVKKGGKQVKILLAGLFMAIVSSFFEIIYYYAHSISGSLSYHMSYIHVGVLCFVISLIWIVVKCYIETHRQKEAAIQSAMESTLHSERLKDEMALKHLEAKKLQELDQMKSQFFANVSHEFRTPLTLIIGNAQQLAQKFTDKDTATKFKRLLRNSNRLFHLVNQLLDISRLESGKTTLHAQPANLVSFIKSICQTFNSLFEEKNLQFNFLASDKEILVYFDSDKMEKIINNLVYNAIKFTPAGGSINVLITYTDPVEIHITDTGPGIAAEHLPHIFDRFYQIGNGLNDEQQGSGIGLALARELVTLHHGELLAQSIVGEGSVFIIRLPQGRQHLNDSEIGKADIDMKIKNNPAHVQYDIPTSKTAQNTNIISKSDKPTMLIIEDNDEMREYISNELHAEYQLLEAGNGKTGFEMAAQHIPDIIITDVMMPVMDGFQLCQKLKTDERTSHIPIIMLTARSSSESKLEGLELGADDYLVKPFDAQELRTRSRNLVAQRRKLRERFKREITVPLSEITVSTADKKFMQRAIQIIEEHMDIELETEKFSQLIGLSRSQLHRKLDALTGQSASEFIRAIRLKRAAQLLESHTYTISEIAYATGFGSVDYFRRCFKKQFGVTPSEYLNEQ